MNHGLYLNSMCTVWITQWWPSDGSIPRRGRVNKRILRWVQGLSTPHSPCKLFSGWFYVQPKMCCIRMRHHHQESDMKRHYTGNTLEVKHIRFQRTFGDVDISLWPNMCMVICMWNKTLVKSVMYETRWDATLLSPLLINSSWHSNS